MQLFIFTLKCCSCLVACGSCCRSSASCVLLSHCSVSGLRFRLKMKSSVSLSQLFNSFIRLSSWVTILLVSGDRSSRWLRWPTLGSTCSARVFWLDTNRDVTQESINTYKKQTWQDSPILQVRRLMSAHWVYSSKNIY